MIVVMRPTATQDEVDGVRRTVEENGLEAFISVGEERTVIGVVGSDLERVAHLGTLDGVEQVIRISSPYKLASSEHQVERTRVRINGVELGLGQELVVMAGPCAVESREQLMETARCVKREGARVLRGGAFKPRTSPYSFQGLGLPALELLHQAHDEYGLPVISEIVDPTDVPAFDEHVDIIQVGARNMANFVLLKAVGQSRRPVLLKRGLSRHDRGVAARRRVHPLRRQPERDPVRARHPHLRDRDAQHARPLGGASPALPDAPADHRRPEPRHRPSSPGCADGPGGRRRRRRRPDHRGPSRSRERPDPMATRASASMSSARSWTSCDGSSSSDRRDAQPAAASTSVATGEIEDVRDRIDDLDARLAEMVQERAALALEVQRRREPTSHGHDVRRERALLEQAATGTTGPMTPVELTMVFDALLRASRSVQRRHAHSATEADAAATGSGR